MTFIKHDLDQLRRPERTEHICTKCNRRPWAYDPGKAGAPCWWSGCDGTLKATKQYFLPLDPYPIGHWL